MGKLLTFWIFLQSVSSSLWTFSSALLLNKATTLVVQLPPNSSSRRRVSIVALKLKNNIQRMSNYHLMFKGPITHCGFSSHPAAITCKVPVTLVCGAGGFPNSHSYQFFTRLLTTYLWSTYLSACWCVEKSDISLATPFISVDASFDANSPSTGGNITHEYRALWGSGESSKCCI